jgi:hypothetical protein
MSKYTLIAPPAPALDDDPQAMLGEQINSIPWTNTSTGKYEPSAPVAAKPKYTLVSTADAPARYFDNSLDQSIAETPIVGQIFRGLANTVDSAKALGYRGAGLFYSATDSPAYADEANANADAIQAEMSRREQEFGKTSNTAGNVLAGLTQSLSTMFPVARVANSAMAPIAVASAQQGNQALYEGRKAGLTGADLGAHVASQALYEGVPAYMSQRLGVGGLEQRAAGLSGPIEKGVRAAFDRFVKTTGQELPEELVTTYMEQIGSGMAGVDSATPEDLVNGAYMTTLQTLASGGLMEAPSLLSRKAPSAPSGTTSTPDPNRDTIPPSGRSTDPLTDEDYRALFPEPISEDGPFPAVPDGTEPPVPIIPLRPDYTEPPTTDTPAYAPEQQPVEPMPMGRASSMGQTPRFSVNIVDMAQPEPMPFTSGTSMGQTPQNVAYTGDQPAVESVPFGTQWDRTMSPREALGMLAGVDLSQPQESDLGPMFEQAASMPPKPKDEVGVRAIDALYAIAQENGGLDATAMDESLDEFLAEFAPSERRAGLKVWTTLRDEMDQMTPEQQDQWASLITGTQPETAQETTSTPEATQPTPEPQVTPQATTESAARPELSPLADVLDRYEGSGDLTDQDFVDEVRRLISDGAAPKSLMKHVNAYDKARRLHRESGYRMDDGGDEAAALADAIRAKTGDTTAEAQGNKPKVADAEIDFSGISNANTEDEAITAIGNIFWRASQGLGPHPSASQQAKMRDMADKRVAELNKIKEDATNAAQPANLPAEPVRADGGGERPAAVQGVPEQQGVAFERLRERVRDSFVNKWGEYVDRSNSTLLRPGRDFVDSFRSGKNWGGGVRFTLDGKNHFAKWNNRSRVYEVYIGDSEGAGWPVATVLPHEVANPPKVSLQESDTTPSTRPAPPRKGTTSESGWSTVSKGVARKDIHGQTVELVRQKDGSWSVTRNEKEVDSGYKSRAEAEKYADGELAQDILDQRNADQERSLLSDAPTIQEAQAVIESKLPGYEPRVDVPPITQAEAKKVVANSTGEKVSAKTGLTKTQTEVLSTALRDAVERLPSEADVVGASTRDYSVTPKQLLNKQYVEIEVPGDGKFKVVSKEAASALHKRITGQPIEGVEPTKAATTPDNTASKRSPLRLPDPAKRTTPEGYDDERDFYRRQDAARNPSSADTQIFADLTTAAREGKAFVESLYPRIQPVLARIHKGAKDPADFIRQAVARIGNHIRPYAKRFLAEVRRGLNEETGAVRKPTSILQQIRAERANATKEAQRTAKAEKKDAVAEAVAEERFKAGETATKSSEKAASDKAKAVTSATSKTAREQYGVGLEAGRQEAGATISEMQRTAAQDKSDAVAEAQAEGREVAKQANESGFHEGLDTGRSYGRSEAIREAQDIMDKDRRIVPPELRRLREAAMRKLLSDTTVTPERRAARQRKVLDAIRADVAKYEAIASTMKAAAEVKKVRKFLSPELYAEANKLLKQSETKTGLKSLTRDKVLEIGDALEAITEQHKADSGVLAQIRAEKTKANKTIAVQDVKTRTKNKDMEPRQNQTWGEGFSAYTQHTENLVRKFVGNNSYAKRVLIDLPIEAQTALEGLLNKYQSELSSALKAAGITPKDLDDMSHVHGGYAERREGTKKIIDRLGDNKLAKALGLVKPKYRTVMVGGKQVRLTGAEIVSIMLHAKDPSTRAALPVAGFVLERGGRTNRFKMDDSDIAAVRDASTAKERKMAEILWRFNNGMLRDDMNAWSVKHLGYEIAKSDEHYTRRRHMSDKEPGLNLQSGDVAQQYVEHIGSLKARTGGKQPIVLGDAIQETASHMFDIANVIAKYEASVDARRLLDTTEFTDAAKRSGNSAALKEVRDRINDWGSIKHDTPEAMSMGIARAIGRNIVTSNLSANVPVQISQSFSLINAMRYIPPQYLLKQTRPYSHAFKQQIKDEIWQYGPDMRRVFDQGGLGAVTPGSASSSPAREAFGNRKAKIHDMMMRGISWNNEQAVYRMWEAAKAWGRAQGLEGQALMEFTAKTTRDAWIRSQPSDNPFFQTGVKLASKKSTTAYVVSMFQGQTAIQYNQAMEAVRDWQESGKSVADYRRLATGVLVPTILSAMLFEANRATYKAALSALKDDEDDDKKKAGFVEGMVANMLGGTLGMIPGWFGPLIDSIVEEGDKIRRNESTYSDFHSNAITESTNQAYTVLRNIVANQKKGKPSFDTEGKRRAALRALGIATGTPFQSVYDHYKVLEGALK